MCHVFRKKWGEMIVPDSGSRDRVFVFVGAGCWGNLRRDAGNLEWGEDGEGLRKGRLVHE
jgi:hypothetical protein